MRIMDKITFPKITVTVQAEPWAEGHVARIVSPHIRFKKGQ